MKRTNHHGDAHTIGIIVLAVIVVGVLCYAALQSYIDTTMRNANSSVNNGKTVAEMQRRVKKEMQKSEVNAMIGGPYECMVMRVVELDNEQHKTQRCSYGNPIKGSYLSVTYMDGKVWGTSAEEGGKK